MQKIIEVKNLTRSFKQYKKQPGVLGSLKSVFKREYFTVDAVKDISFDIEPGEMVGFIGPNGAGKTTTLKMLSGVLYPTSGEVSVLGYKPYERKSDFQKRFSLVMGQKSQLWWELPAIEGFLLNKEIYGVDTVTFNKTITELAELLDVADVLQIPVRKLSLGQRMKCELLASLIHKPEIMFLDEPTIGLDVVVQKRIRKFFKDYNRNRQTTLILTSHYMDDVEELCERVIVINHGSIVFDGSLANLQAGYAREKYLKLIFKQPVELQELGNYGKLLKSSKDGLSATIAVPRDDHTRIAAAVLQNFPVDDLDIAETTLEDIISKIFQS